LIGHLFLLIRWIEVGRSKTIIITERGFLANCIHTKDLQDSGSAQKVTDDLGMASVHPPLPQSQRSLLFPAHLYNFPVCFSRSPCIGCSGFFVFFPVSEVDLTPEQMLEESFLLIKAQQFQIARRLRAEGEVHSSGGDLCLRDPE
jgi:hypothetical protein